MADKPRPMSLPHSTDSPQTTSSEAPEAVRLLRREIALLKSEVFELQDRILAKDTEKADAVALLGRAELELESKLAYIVELDRALNTRIRELEHECDRKTTEIDQRGEALAAARAETSAEVKRRDEIIADLTSRLEQANQEISRAHGLAGEYAAKWDGVKQDHAKEVDAHQTTNRLLQAAETKLGRLTVEGQKIQARAEQLERDLHDTAERLAVAETKIATIKVSLWWRMGRPWRALFGPKE